jgi:hypothetical protein
VSSLDDFINAPDEPTQYKIVVDLGKPFTETASDLDELKNKLEEIYNTHIKGQEYAHIDITVYDPLGKDITEEQAIIEMIEDIMLENNDEPAPMQEPAKPEIPLKTASGRASVTAKPAGFKPGDKVKSAIGEVFTVKEIDPDYPDIEVTDAKGVSYYGMATSFEGVM